MSNPEDRVREFLRQWAMMRDKSNMIIGVLADPEQDDTVDLTVSDLRAILDELERNRRAFRSLANP